MVDLNPTVHRHTLELLALAVRLGYHVLQPVKHYLGCPRPANYSPSIQPVIRPRRFQAFPSGHAMEAFLIARLLQVIINCKREPNPKASLDTLLQRLAARIANNRVVAGVHFHIDSVAGRMVAESLAEYFIGCCTGGNGTYSEWFPRCFDGKSLTGDTTKEPELSKAFLRKEVMTGADAKSAYFKVNQSIVRPIRVKLTPGVVEDKPREPAMLNRLWQAAVAEWR